MVECRRQSCRARLVHLTHVAARSKTLDEGRQDEGKEKQLKKKNSIVVVAQQGRYTDWLIYDMKCSTNLCFSYSGFHIQNLESLKCTSLSNNKSYVYHLCNKTCTEGLFGCLASQFTLIKEWFATKMPGIKWWPAAPRFSQKKKKVMAMVAIGQSRFKCDLVWQNK